LDNRSSLPNGTLLDGSYRIERLLASGGFGVTYEAAETMLGTRVAIKEYYPSEFGQRDSGMRVRPLSERQKPTFEWGRKSFLEEARTLARFRHPSIVRVTRVFEANATAYMVMDFEEGLDFENWLNRLKRLPTQAELERIAAPILDALELMHRQNFLHRDIAPDNIIIRSDGTPVLLDFGAARRAVAEMSRTLTGIVKTGYSPFEQYATDGRLQGPWTDIYALGATLYRAIAGKAPEEATLRIAEDRLLPATEVGAGLFEEDFLAAIDACLKTRYADRPQTMAGLRPLLFGRRESVPKPKRVIEYRNPTRSSSTPAKATLSSSAGRIKLIATATVVLMLGIGAGGYYAWTARQAEKPAADASRKDPTIRTVTPQPIDDATALARITKSFRIIDDVAAKGKEYRMTRGSMFEQCAQQCTSDAQCRMFAYWANQICYLFDGYFGTYPTKASRVGTKLQ